MAVVTSLADSLRNTQVDLPPGEPVLEVESLHLSFGAVKAVVDVSFRVEKGELFSIIGPNGAGKTSIFNCLSGVYRPQQGVITFLGEPIIGKKPHKIAALGMARTFQNIELFENLTVLDNIMLGRHQHLTYRSGRAMAWVGRAKRQELENRRIVEDIIDFLEVAPYRKSIVGMLPYGIQKRVELGRAIAMEPKLLLLDEPVAGMNLEETEDMARFILDIQEELGIATILVEHDMGVVMDIADRVLVMDFGRIIAIGSPEDVQQDPEVIRAYLGSEAHVAELEETEEDRA
jgi:branched-chain amino acid transport system ATP-binding protein